MIKNKKDGLWRIPGGHVEEGESYHDAAARELSKRQELVAS
jgi:ADP-ribose pyrophosphatase YjhB (NUDIX family)